MKNLFKTRGRKFIIILLTFSLVIGSVFVADASVTGGSSGSAEERIVEFINMAAGKTTVNGEMNMTTLTKDELRFLGVYISNFFVPFGTELGSSDEDISNQTKEDIIQALQTSLNFDDGTASTLTETIMGLSRSNNKELEFRVSKEYQEGYVDFDLPVNYYTFLRLMLGLGNSGYAYNKDVFEYFEGQGGVGEDIFDGEYDYGYFGYVEDGEFVPMFDCWLKGDDSITTSQYVFLQCLGSVSIEKGYGFNFFDFTVGEMRDEPIFASMAEGSAFTDEEICRMTAYGSMMYVDCFGNIIVKGGNHQYVAVPGCMNPYTWVTVNDEGDDVLVGQAYNISTFMGLGLSDTDQLLNNHNAVSDSHPRMFPFSLSKVNDSLEVMEGSQGEWNPTIENIYFYNMTLARGSRETSFSNGIFSISDIHASAEKAEDGYASLYGNDYKEAFCYNVRNDFFAQTSTIDTRGVSYFQDSYNIGALDGFVFIDNLGAFHFDNSDTSVDYQVININHYLDTSGNSVNALYESWGNSADNGFTNMYNDISSGRLNLSITVEDKAVVGLYSTYAIAGLYKNNSDAKKETIGKLGYRINKEGLINISEDPLMLEYEGMPDYTVTSIKNWLYYLLHPTQGIVYFRELISNKVEGLLLGWHNDMVGTNGVGVITGTTKYRGQSGYVTTPDLSEIQWSSELLNFYNEILPFLILFMLVIMIVVYVIGILSLQKAIIGFLIFALCTALPPSIINGVVGTSNRVISNIYGEKFTYWALVQHETYSSNIDSSVVNGNYENYLRTLYSENSKISSQGTESIMLKWQAPKKMSSLTLTSEDNTILNNLTNSSLISSVLNNSYSGEAYLEEDSTYLYRSYIDIANFSRYIYRGIKDGSVSSYSTVSSEGYSNIYETDEKLYNRINSRLDSDYALDRRNGYTNVNGDGSSDANNAIRLRAVLSSSIYNRALAQKGTISSLGISQYVGIHQDAFNFSIPMFNAGLDIRSELANASVETQNGSVNDFGNTILANYTNKDFTSLASYGLMSENVFYYFSWGLYDMGMDPSVNADGGYKSLLLSEEDGGFFYNLVDNSSASGTGSRDNNGNGELKDFMDMKSLFTYIIPYLKQGNDIVKEWDEVYGIYIYEGVPTEEGMQQNADITGDAELKQKYWHNLNVARLYNIYTPWVDIMYECSYANPETIEYLGEKYEVEDPINPDSYPADRPMIFSESEMTDYGLKESQLTKVERLILDCNKDMQERMFNLLNYYTFNDVTLNTAAAMNCAFAFNNTFSENGLFKENHNIYPQSFELADFSYDAYLRFILASSTGENMLDTNADFYQTIVQNSSMTTAIVMILLDIVSVYIVPWVKIFFILAMFILSVLMIIASALKIEQEESKTIKRLFNCLVLPMIKFLAITVIFAWVINLFIGEGYTGVTGATQLTISLGDPVMVMLAMLVVNIASIILYGLVIKDVLQDLKKQGKLVGSFATGVVHAVGLKVNNITSGAKGGSNKDISSNDSVDRSSPRAQRRGNGSVTDKDDRFDEDASNSRRNNTRKKPIKEKVKTDDSSSEKTDSINEKVQSGVDNLDS